MRRRLDFSRGRWHHRACIKSRGWSALANLPNRARWFPQRGCGISATKRSREKPALPNGGLFSVFAVVDFKQAKEQREREQRKVDPKRQKLVGEIAQYHPEWRPKELEKLHQKLDAWGE